MSLKKTLLALVCCVSLLAVGCGGGGGGGGAGPTPDTFTIAANVVVPPPPGPNIRALSADDRAKLRARIDGQDSSSALTFSLANGIYKATVNLTVNEPFSAFYDVIVYHSDFPTKKVLMGRVSFPFSGTRVTEVGATSTVAFSILKEKADATLTEVDVINGLAGLGNALDIIGKVLEWIDAGVFSGDVDATAEMTAFINAYKNIAYTKSEDAIRKICTNNIAAKLVADQTSDELMSYISVNYKTTDSSTDVKNDVKFEVDEKLKDYKITAYVFNINKVQFVSQNRLRLTTTIDVSGEERGSNAQVGPKRLSGDIDWVYGAENELVGNVQTPVTKWRIFRGLPYKNIL